MNFELQLETGASLLKQAPQDVLQMDASLFGWGAALQGKSIRGAWSLLERKWHINKLELLAVKLALQTFLKSKNFTSIHIQMDNIVTLTYLKKGREPRIRKWLYCQKRSGKY